ncbi:MAG: zf-HC2 domain-containing protein [Gemmatimonadales bacterium]|nr:zf-HC2 domain-containing protein [Gemmatimonadales bacterium]
MKHVTERIHAWLAGELDPVSATDLEQHLEQCPDCARVARESRAVWETLGSAAAEDEQLSSPSLWPRVRARTFGEQTGGSWFYGPSSVVRAGLASAAVAAGLVFAVMLPGEGLNGDQNSSDQQVETLWLEDSSWTSADQDYGLDRMWLSAGLDTEG